MPFENWDDVASALLRTLGQLSDGDFLILGEPTSEQPPRRRFPWRRVRPPATRYVQVLRLDDLFTAECVGATSLGGTWPMNARTIDELGGLGWRTPAESKREFGNLTPNFDMYVALTAAPTLTELLVASLVCLGVQPHELTLTMSPERP